MRAGSQKRAVAARKSCSSMRDRIGVCQGVCLGQNCDNESSCGIVSEGAGTDEKLGIYSACPYQRKLLVTCVSYTCHACHMHVKCCDCFYIYSTCRSHAFIAMHVKSMIQNVSNMQLKCSQQLVYQHDTCL